MTIPTDSLLNLPQGAVYHQKSGQAEASVSKQGKEIVFVATCDSLEREVEYYCELYYSTLYELNQLQNRVKTEKEQHYNPIKIAIIGFLVGLVAGTILIIIKTKP